MNNELSKPITETLNVNIKRIHSDATMPYYATAGAAGFDLAAAESVTVRPGGVVKVRTGWSFQIPPGFELQLRPRSGLSAKTGLRIPNAPATIDSDFRGEVMVLLEVKAPHGPVEIKKGDRICQGVIVPVYQAVFSEVGALEETARGEGAFGSTGVNTKEAE